jgi:hypothetical protein
MNTLRKRPTYDDLIRYLDNQPTIKYPVRNGLSIINDFKISNFMIDTSFTDEDIAQKKEEMVDKREKEIIQQKGAGTQTEESLDKGTQEDYRVKYD